MTAARYADVPNRTVDGGGAPFGYRELGTASGVPVILLTQLALRGRGSLEVALASSLSWRKML